MVLNNLYKQTQLQDTFGMNMAAMDGCSAVQPRELIEAFRSTAASSVTRRTVLELRRASAPRSRAWPWRYEHRRVHPHHPRVAHAARKPRLVLRAGMFLSWYTRDADVRARRR